MPKSESPHHRGYYELPAGSIEQLQSELTQCRSRLAARDAELNLLRHEYSKLHHSNKEYHQAYKMLQHERNGLSQDLENTTNLSNARGNELAGAQAFLTKADSISAVELRDVVDALNEEIFQTAAALGDCIVRKKYDSSDDELRTCIKRLRPVVGKGFLQILSAQSAPEYSRRTVNPLLAQVVAQVILVDRCKYEVDRWDPNRSDLSNGLTELYRGMQVSEKQSVFGRWRALTLAQIKPDLEAWRKDALQILKILLEFACWDTSSTSHLEAFESRLGTIFKAVQQVRRAIGQDIISEDYKSYIIPPDRPFKAIGMEEVYGDNKKPGPLGSQGAFVLGTTALGLMKMVVPFDGPQELGHCVVLPKVVVDTSFREILSTHSSSDRKVRPVHYHDGRD